MKELFPVKSAAWLLIQYNRGFYTGRLDMVLDSNVITAIISIPGQWFNIHTDTLNRALTCAGFAGVTL